MSPAIRAICYVDFAGNLDQTACSGAPDDGRQVTHYMSSATCHSCIAAIQARIAKLHQETGAGGSRASTSSTACLT
jgi:hypothetical protein